MLAQVNSAKLENLVKFIVNGKKVSNVFLLMNSTLANLEIRVYAPKSEAPLPPYKRCLAENSLGLGNNTFLSTCLQKRNKGERKLFVSFACLCGEILSFLVTFHFSHPCQQHDFTTHCGDRLQPFPSMLYSDCVAQWQHLLCFSVVQMLPWF